MGLALGVVLAPVVQSASLAARRVERVIGTLGPAELPELPERSRILGADGSVVATLHLDENREVVPLRRVPDHLERAVLAAEDSSFWEHDGLDYPAIARALIVNAASGEIEQGGSTITQQLAKNVFTSGDRTLRRKLRESLYAMRLETTYGKDEILEKYLNEVYLGDGVYGVAAAVEHYFGRRLGTVTLAESALLAGMIASPERYSPRNDRKAARQRRSVILSRMASLGWIGQARAEKATAAPIDLSTRLRRANDGARFPYVVDHVRREILSDPAFGGSYEDRVKLLFQGGLTIETTLRPDLQRAAERAIRRQLPLPGDPEGSIVAIAPRTGAIRALIGGQNFRKQKFNLATQAERQPGSAFKPFTLVTALQRGIGPSATYSGRAPVRIPMPGGQQPWVVHNAESSSYGTIDLRTATVNSVNAVYAQLVMDVGPGRVARTARQMGIGRKLPSVPSITLGSVGVTPLEMAKAYATFANRGVHCPPFVVRRVLDRDGDVIYDRREDGPGCRHVFHPALADVVVDILQDAVREGTGRAASLGERPAFGKTGTTNDYGDAWFVGCTRQLCASSWVGHRRGRVPMTNVHGIRVFGGTFPAAIWRAFMSTAMAGKPIKGFREPPPWRWILLNVVDRVQVPDVVGRLLDAAVDALESVGLLVTIATTSTDDLSRSGLVVAQSPEGGEQAPLGWAIRLTVLRYVEPEPPREEKDGGGGRGGREDDRGGNGKGNGPPDEPPGQDED